MRSIPIKDHTHRLGAPATWDHSKEGICHTIEILDQDGWMVSAWMPTPKEREQLLAGYPILLFVQGELHPVVSMAIGGMMDAD